MGSLMQNRQRNHGQFIKKMYNCIINLSTDFLPSFMPSFLGQFSVIAFKVIFPADETVRKEAFFYPADGSANWYPLSGGQIGNIFLF